jgi:hypothetical protein
MSVNQAPPPANWYADPTQPGQLRYWDGSQWTQNVAPGGPAVAQPAAGASAPKKGLSAGWIVAIVVGVIVLLLGPLTAIAIPLYLNQRGEAADDAAKASLQELSIVFAEFFVDYPADQPSVTTEGNLVILTAPDGSSTAATLEPGVEYGGFVLTDSYDMCVWVHAPEGNVQNFEWSSSTYLAEGDCS